MLKYLTLVLGVFCGATAVIMIKDSTVDPLALGFFRLAIAVAVLCPLFLRDLRRNSSYGWRQVARSILPGVLMGAHFITWNIGARQTSAANASLVCNFAPVVMPFLMYFLIRERLTRLEFVGTGVAVAGVAVLGVGDLNLDPAMFAGDAMCFGSMLLYASYLALGRLNRDVPTLWLYVVPLYVFAGVTCLVGSLALGRPMTFADPQTGQSLRNVLDVIGLGIIPTVLGHSIMNHSMRIIRGQIVSIIGLGQFVFAGVMAYILKDEIPKLNFYIAAVMVVAGAVLSVRGVTTAGQKATLEGMEREA